MERADLNGDGDGPMRFNVLLSLFDSAGSM